MRARWTWWCSSFHQLREVSTFVEAFKLCFAALLDSPPPYNHINNPTRRNEEEEEMKRASSQPLLRYFQVDDETDDEEEQQQQRIIIKGKSFRDIESITKQVNCITINKREHKKPCEDYFSWERYDIWRQEQKNGAVKLKKQLKARWTMQKLIDEQLGRFEDHYNRAMAPTKMSNVAQLLMPKWIPPYELAALSWLGDWRPSTILEFLRSLSHSLSDTVGVERALSQLINDIRIEEAVIDEEMTEIQATCVLNLPFGPNSHGNEPALARVRSEFKKIHRVIIKAQNLRIKALQLAVNNVLSQTDAAEFLVDFAGIQDAIHHVATKYKTGKGPVCIKNLDISPIKWEQQ